MTIDIDDAIAFNAARRKAGQFTDEHEAMLVAFLQQFAPREVVAALAASGALGADAEHDLDAKFGDESAALLKASFDYFTRSPAYNPPDAPPAPTPEAVGFAATFLEVCREELGKGEEIADNSGPNMVRWRGLPPEYATKKTPWAHWCAFSLGWMIREAYRRMGRPDDGDFMMFHDKKFGGKKMPIGGARDLVRRAAECKHGRWVARKGKILEPLQPGDLVAIAYNSDPNERHGVGHVFTVAKIYPEGPTKIDTMEGNLGPFPAVFKYKRRNLYALGGSARLLQAARLG